MAKPVMARLRKVMPRITASITRAFPENHEQQCNNNNKNIKRSSSENSDESSDARLKKFLSAHPEAAVYTPSGAKWGSAEDLKTLNGFLQGEAD
jgi:hypothetical protein